MSMRGTVLLRCGAGSRVNAALYSYRPTELVELYCLRQNFPAIRFSIHVYLFLCYHLAE